MPRKRTNPVVQRDWDEFWAPLLMKNGRLDKELLKEKLHDYHELLDRIRQTYTVLNGEDVPDDLSVVDEVLKASHPSTDGVFYVSVEKCTPANVWVLLPDGEYLAVWDGLRLLPKNDKPIPPEWIDDVTEAVRGLKEVC